LPAENKNSFMDHPFPKSTTITERAKKLQDMVTYDDTLAVLINADPDAMASAMALKRLFWRKVKKTYIYRINVIKRADNLAMIRLLKMDQRHIRRLDSSEITKWAIIDSQPYHNEQFSKFKYDIIIDHHPVDSKSRARFIDIRDDYGATSTIMTEYLRSSGIKPSPRLATALFYGIKTDTDNFVRDSIPNDLNAFRYLYQFVNIHNIKKIESSELTKKTLKSYRDAMEHLIFIKDKAYVHMGEVDNPDILVLIADFFLKMAESTWSIASGVNGKKLIIIIRNAGFRLDAGKISQKLFGDYGTAGGHKSAARAEIPLSGLKKKDYTSFITSKLKEM
jgi:nanoRNase/pAp phosphatase (c-di-AMP/oligoRNAs hydrolase)